MTSGEQSVSLDQVGLSKLYYYLLVVLLLIQDLAIAVTCTCSLNLMTSGEQSVSLDLLLTILYMKLVVCLFILVHFRVPGKIYQFITDLHSGKLHNPNSELVCQSCLLIVVSWCVSLLNPNY